MNRICWGLSLALLAGGVAGCGPEQLGEHRTYPVTGTVHYKGQPLPGAYVAFSPTQPKMPGAYATTDDQGQFRLNTYGKEDGAAAGAYKVVVTKFAQAAKPREIEPGVPDPTFVSAETHSLIPAKYGHPTQSGLSAQVTAEGTNEFRFDLQ